MTQNGHLIEPSNSARVFKRPAEILRHSSVEQLLDGCRNGHIVEYGPGCLRNAFYLQRKQFNVAVIELAATRGRFEDRYKRFDRNGGAFIEWEPNEITPTILPSNHRPKPDLAVMTFVLETIAEPSLRRFMLHDCSNRLKSDGALVLSVRGVSDVVTAHSKGRKYSDGFVTPLRTFIRPFTIREVQKLLLEASFNNVQFLHKKQTKAPELIHAIARKN